VSRLNSLHKVYGEVVLYTTKNKIIKHNSIINLSALLNLIAYTKSTPSSIKTPMIQTDTEITDASYSVQEYENGYMFVFTATFQQPINVRYAVLYPSSMSLFGKPLALIIYNSEVSGVTQIEWTIYIQDNTGVLLNLIPPQTIPSVNFAELLYIEDDNTNALLNLNNYNQYLYTYFQDPTIGNPITNINTYFFTFLNYTKKPSAVRINNNFTLQLLPASEGQYTVFYFLWNSQNLKMQFTFSSGSFPLGDGFAICLYSTTPPILFNTSTPSGMTNGILAYGSGNQVVVEFNPYSSQPISVTWWTESGYKQTILSSSGNGSGIQMNPGDIFEISIQVSGTSMTITVTDLTVNKTIVSQTVTLPFTPPKVYYVIITARNINGYADWSLINLRFWYPYSVQIPVNYTSPQLLPITVIYSND